MFSPKGIPKFYIIPIIVCAAFSMRSLICENSFNGEEKEEMKSNLTSDLKTVGGLNSVSHLLTALM